MVSLVFVTYNRASRVALSLEDILNQTFKDFELIICDDCSTDGTSEICQTYAKRDTRITYIRQERNLGMPGNVNVGIRKAQYPYIGILHDGDRFERHLVERWYHGITSSPKVGVAFCGLSEIDRPPPPEFLDAELEEGLHRGSYLLENFYFKNYSFASIIYGMAMFRSEFAQSTGGFDYRYGFYSDVDFWMNILQNNDAYYCNESLIRYPSKEEQPRVFDDRQVKTLLNLHKMFLKHRIIFYRKKPIALVRAIAVHYGYLIFRFLLIIRFLARTGNRQVLKNNISVLLQEQSFLILLTPIWFFLRIFFLVKPGKVVETK